MEHEYLFNARCDKHLERITELQQLIAQEEKQLFEVISMNTKCYDALSYPTTEYQKLMQQYCDFFNSFFKVEAPLFFYLRWTKADQFLQLSNSVALNDLTFECDAYEDSPLCVRHANAKSGCYFTWPDSNQEQAQYNQLRKKVQEKFKASYVFGIQIKQDDYCENIGWQFKDPNQTEKPTEKSRKIILQEYVKHHTLISALINQFRETIVPIIEKEELLDVSLRDLKPTLYETQAHVIQQKDVSDINSLDLSVGAKLLAQAALKPKAPNDCLLSDNEKEQLRLLEQQSFH